ncbi:MAG TPA: hypothetical protein VHP33_00880 [Polyangiaceae bacterium]|nr:hypothetical protein [Polyangiaceae bacterium]
MANQNVQLTFVWDGQQRAQVYYVIDNGRATVLADAALSGRGRVVVSFTTAASATHVLKWSLWFPGKTLKNLALSATVNGVSKSIASDESEEHHWAGEGVWR